MKRIGNSQWIGLTVVVIAHLVVSLVHGMAHAKGNVPLSPAANIFVFAIILAGPLVGLGLAWLIPRVGTLLIGLTMAASLVFGLLNHFVFAGTDHVAHVDAAARPLFATTAVLLVLTEALGAGLAIRSLRASTLTRPFGPPSPVGRRRS